MGAAGGRNYGAEAEVFERWRLFAKTVGSPFAFDHDLALHRRGFDVC